MNSAEFVNTEEYGKNTIFPEFWENLEHAQTVYTRLSFPPTPLIREPGYEAKAASSSTSKCNTLHKSPLDAEINFYSKSLSEGRATAGKAVQHGVGHFIALPD